MGISLLVAAALAALMAGLVVRFLPSTPPAAPTDETEPSLPLPAGAPDIVAP